VEVGILISENKTQIEEGGKGLTAGDQSQKNLKDKTGRSEAQDAGRNRLKTEAIEESMGTAHADLRVKGVSPLGKKRKILTIKGKLHSAKCKRGLTLFMPGEAEEAPQLKTGG